MIHKHAGKMDVTRECISRILELREILLSFQTGFNLVKAVNLVSAAVVCGILERLMIHLLHAFTTSQVQTIFGLKSV